MESPTEREQRLQRRRERERASRAGRLQLKQRNGCKREIRGCGTESKKATYHRENILGRVKDFQLKLKNSERSD